MASAGESDGPRRKKRAWRQPRHPAGVGTSSTTSAQSDPLADASSTAAATESDKRSSTETRADVKDSRPVSEKRKEKKKQRVVEVRAELAGEQQADTGGGEERETDGGGVGVATAGLVEIDGSVMEGGGQILRNALTLSVLLRRSIRVTRIRAGRSKPGLRPQHLAGLHLIGQLCDGRLTGDYVNSTEVELHPGVVRHGDFSADTQTAGSTCLLLQVALPCLLFAPLTSSSSSSSPSTTLTLRGGTDADMAPPIDYISKVFQPIAAKFGVNFDCDLRKRGFYPRGGGEVIVKPHPLHHLTPVTITEPGHVTSVSIHSYASGTVPEKVAKQMAQSARQYVEKQLPGVAVTTNEVKETANSAYGNGSGIIVVAETSTGCLFGGSANGKRDDPPYKSGKAAAEQMMRGIKEGGCVDEHLQDQLIIFMALAKGRSVVRTGSISLHTKTAIHVARSLTSAVFNIRKLDGDAHLIECDGIGLENRS